MAKQRKSLGITCDSTDCANGLHCFKASQELIEKNKTGICRECGASLVDWHRVHKRNPADIEYTFNALKYECVRHHFWHKDLSQKAINHARRKGKSRLKKRVHNYLEGAIGGARPYHDGFQTTMKDDAPTAVPYGQHATATCCRKCLEYWHAIPPGQELTPQQLDYCTELVCKYIEERIPELTQDGEQIPPIRSTQI